MHKNKEKMKSNSIKEINYLIKREEREAQFRADPQSTTNRTFLNIQALMVQKKKLLMTMYGKVIKAEKIPAYQ